jgi:hypothetical protein
MYKSLLSLGALLTVSLTQAQISVPQVQKSLYTPIEATWCGFCGKNGIPTTAEVYSEVSDKAIFMGLQPSNTSALYAPKASSIVNKIGGVSGYPSIALNFDLIGVLTPGKKTQLINGINDKYNATETDVNAGFHWYKTDDSLVVLTNTKFFNELEGEFKTGVYITQDSIWEYQTNYDANIPNGNIYHFHVMRDVMSSDAFGVATGSGTVTSGTEIVKRHAIEWNADWDINNIHINTVVWKTNGSAYDFKNANNVGQKIQEPGLSINDELQINQINVFPNPSSGVIKISSKYELQNIEIFDSKGSKVAHYQKNSNPLKSIDISNLKSGFYILKGSDKKGNSFSNSIIKN